MTRQRSCDAKSVAGKLAAWKGEEATINSLVGDVLIGISSDLFLLWKLTVAPHANERCAGCLGEKESDVSDHFTGNVKKSAGFDWISTTAHVSARRCARGRKLQEVPGDVG